MTNIMRESAKLEEYNWELTLLEVQVVPGLVRDHRGEAFPDNAVPVRT